MSNFVLDSPHPKANLPQMSLPSIPPELFPLIASFIPLRSAPKTLLALAMGNSHFYCFVRPLLYSRLVAGSEDTAIAVLKKIMDEPQLAMGVTEIHIMSELSKDTLEGKKPFDIMSALQYILVKKKLVPRLIALGIYLLDGWTYPYSPSQSSLVDTYVNLLLPFWKTLRVECPHLQSLSLRNLGYGPNQMDPWLADEKVIDEIIGIPGLSTLRLECQPGGTGLPMEQSRRVLNNLPQLAASLHTLSLNAAYNSIEPILSIHFVNLKWLRLSLCEAGNYPLKAMEFFRRHQQLESLSLINSIRTWFYGDIEEGFLPNLKHLKAAYNDVVHLTPILPRLVSLSITKSFNCQVPYLLRSVLPNGLPKLKSLENIVTYFTRGTAESLLWYEENEDGLFFPEIVEPFTIRRPGDIKDMRNYILSIVRGAPNLEELCFHKDFTSQMLRELGPTLAQLKSMKRFYCPFDKDYFNSSNLLLDAEALARLCSSLEKVVDISGNKLPYASAIIERDSAGEVTGVRYHNGVGMEISAQDDEPFPVNPVTYYNQYYDGVAY